MRKIIEILVLVAVIFNTFIAIHIYFQTQGINKRMDGLSNEIQRIKMAIYALNGGNVLDLNLLQKKREG